MQHARAAAVTLLLVLIAGCATTEQGGAPPSSSAPAPRAPTASAPGINLAGYSMAFRSGYADGCTSVNGGRKRDESRFKSDTDYAQGWRDGNDICKRKK